MVGWALPTSLLHMCAGLAESEHMDSQHNSDTRLEIRCENCGYNLRGLTEPRCPECGTVFRWEERIEAARGSLDHALFEYQWRRRPVRSFVATLGWSLAPWRMWQRLSRSSPPVIGPLAALLAVAWILFWLLDTLREFIDYQVQFRLIEARFGPSTFQWPGYGWIQWAYLYEAGLLLGGLFLVWLSAQLCGQALSTKRFRQRDLMRLLALAALPTLPVRLSLTTATMFTGWVEFLRAGSAWTRAQYYLIQVPGYVATLFFVVSFCMGASVYLRLRFGWLWALTVLCLAFVLIWSIVMAMSLNYYGTLSNPLIGMLQRWWYGAQSFVNAMSQLP